MAPLLKRQLNCINTARQGFIQKQFASQSTTQKPDSFVKIWFLNLHEILSQSIKN